MCTAFHVGRAFVSSETLVKEERPTSCASHIAPPRYGLPNYASTGKTGSGFG